MARHRRREACSAAIWSLRLQHEGENAVGYGRSDLDITDAAAVRATLRRRQPAVVVNCAAWTAVDDAETNEDAALQVNGHAVASLAAACADHGITLVQVSTDYVFDGASGQPYGETDLPVSAHRLRTQQAAGEQAVLDLLADGGLQATSCEQPGSTVRTDRTSCAP